MAEITKQPTTDESLDVRAISAKWRAEEEEKARRKQLEAEIAAQHDIRRVRMYAALGQHDFDYLRKHCSSPDGQADLAARFIEAAAGAPLPEGTDIDYFLDWAKGEYWHFAKAVIDVAYRTDAPTLSTLLADLAAANTKRQYEVWERIIAGLDKIAGAWPELPEAPMPDTRPQPQPPAAGWEGSLPHDLLGNPCSHDLEGFISWLGARLEILHSARRQSVNGETNDAGRHVRNAYRWLAALALPDAPRWPDQKDWDTAAAERDLTMLRAWATQHLAMSEHPIVLLLDTIGMEDVLHTVARNDYRHPDRPANDVDRLVHEDERKALGFVERFRRKWEALQGHPDPRHVTGLEALTQAKAFATLLSEVCRPGRTWPDCWSELARRLRELPPPDFSKALRSADERIRSLKALTEDEQSVFLAGLIASSEHDSTVAPNCKSARGDRRPDEPLRDEHWRKFAAAVIRIVEAIRTGLRIEGRRFEGKSMQDLERAFEQVSKAYMIAEAIRNPGRLAYKRNHWSGVFSHACLPGINGDLHGLGAIWSKLNEPLDELCELYGFQSFSDDTGRPFFDFRGGKTLPTVPAQLLEMLGTAGSELRRSCLLAMQGDLEHLLDNLKRMSHWERCAHVRDAVLAAQEIGIGDGMIMPGAGLDEDRARERLKRIDVAVENALRAAPLIQSSALLPDEDTTHSEDFTSVRWFGTTYHFSKGHQAESVRALWEAWKQGGLSLSEKTIGDEAGSRNLSFRLLHVFNPTDKKTGKRVKHPAWGTMIQGASKGTFHLVEPK